MLKLVLDFRILSMLFLLLNSLNDNIETGRYLNSDPELRFCELCNMDNIGNEYHICFYRNRYLSNVIPNMFCFVNMLKSVNNKSIGCRIGNFFNTNECYVIVLPSLICEHMLHIKDNKQYCIAKK